MCCFPRTEEGGEMVGLEGGRGRGRRKGGEGRRRRKGGKGRRRRKRVKEGGEERKKERG